jgi:hypothetical protein
MPAVLQAFRLALPIACRPAPGKTRRGAVRSSGGQVASIGSISHSGIGTHRRAAFVLALRTGSRRFGPVDVAPLELDERALPHHPGLL